MTRIRRPWVAVLALLPALAAAGDGYAAAVAAAPAPPAPAPVEYQARCLRAAIEDLSASFGARYPRGAEFLGRLDAIAAAPSASNSLAALAALRTEALRENPLVRDARILVVKRRPKDMQAERKRIVDPTRRITFSRDQGREIGLPSNHECNSSLERDGYDNEIAVLSFRDGAARLETLYRPPDGGYVGEMDLDWDATRLLFTKSQPDGWRVCEVGADGRGFRVVSQLPPDVDCSDPCWLPDGRIVFGSTATFQSVPCWHGLKKAQQLYRMNADGSGVRQLCFDQDHDLHPVVLDSGQILYSRWEYAGISHIYLRILMTMNPDGTSQRASYGSGSWFPNALYFPRELPGQPGRYVAILSGYHGPHRMGRLVIVDARRGGQEAEGIVRRISGAGQPVDPAIRDNLVTDDWPKFLHPWPLSDRHFLVASQPGPGAPWSLCVADTFDNVAVLHTEPGCALLEPVPLAPRPRPRAIADRTDPSRRDAQVYLQDVYRGPGLAGVPRGTVRKLRLVAYHYGYLDMAGPDKVGRGGPWEVMRIVGTVPVEPDGSAFFRVPAETPLAFQALDADGRAIQLMRSWYTAMPGEIVSCSGCHETAPQAAPALAAVAGGRKASEIEPWRGPARGFDFAREVQPVLNRYCVACHDGSRPGRPDLRPEEQVPGYAGLPGSQLDTERMHPDMLAATKGLLRYTPAYEALVTRVRRVGIEDDVAMLVPGEYLAETSPLVQLLRRGHHGVQLDAEAWDRIVTWIDLNAPCHGTWHEVFPIPGGMHERRMALRKIVGGAPEDPEAIPEIPRYDDTPVPAPRPPPPAAPVTVAGWPPGAEAARARQAALGATESEADLGGGLRLRLVRVPGGRFVMGRGEGPANETPAAAVEVGPFWMAACEVSNEQYLRFDPSHESRYYARRHARSDDPGLPLDGPRQPAVRVSWERAMAFCDWLSQRTGRRFSLPTEAQWEWACQAGSDASPKPGEAARCANLADASFAGNPAQVKMATGGLEHLVPEGVVSRPPGDDGAVVTADVGSYPPNAWGLYDLIGNAAEWTRTQSQPYPYRDDDGRNDREPAGRRVVRGGSFFDPWGWARPTARLDYPAWQRVFNVGFRVVCEETPTGLAGAAAPLGRVIAPIP